MEYASIPLPVPALAHCWAQRQKANLDYVCVFPRLAVLVARGAVVLPTHARAQTCRPVYSNGNTKLEYTFPLGMHVLEEAVGTQKSLFMKFMLRLRMPMTTT